MHHICVLCCQCWHYNVYDSVYPFDMKHCEGCGHHLSVCEECSGHSTLRDHSLDLVHTGHAYHPAADGTFMYFDDSSEEESDTDMDDFSEEDFDTDLDDSSEKDPNTDSDDSSKDDSSVETYSDDDGDPRADYRLMAPASFLERTAATDKELTTKFLALMDMQRDVLDITFPATKKYGIDKSRAYLARDLLRLVTNALDTHDTYRNALRSWHLYRNMVGKTPWRKMSLFPDFHPQAELKFKQGCESLGERLCWYEIIRKHCKRLPHVRFDANPHLEKLDAQLERAYYAQTPPTLKRSHQALCDQDPTYMPELAH